MICDRVVNSVELSPVAAAARSTTVASFDHEMVLTSAGCSATELSSEPRTSPAGLSSSSHPVSARETPARKVQINLYDGKFIFLSSDSN